MEERVIFSVKIIDGMAQSDVALKDGMEKLGLAAAIIELMRRDPMFAFLLTDMMDRIIEDEDFAEMFDKNVTTEPDFNKILKDLK